jgi:hypothetical protein
MVELGRSSWHNGPGGRRTVGRLLLLVVLLGLAFGAVLASTVLTRDRSPLTSRPLRIRTLDHPLRLVGSRPDNRFDPPPAGQRAGISAAAVCQAWLRQTRNSYDERAVPSSESIPVTLTWWSRPGAPPVGSAGRLVWLFQLTSVPCLEAGFHPPGSPAPPPDREGCNEYQLFDAHSGGRVGEDLVTRAGEPVLQPA